MISGRRSMVSLCLPLGIVLFFASAVWGHDFWVECKGKEFWLIYGHGDNREDVDPAKVKIVKAFGMTGAEIQIGREKKGKGLLLQPAEPPSWIFVEIDNGYWSKTIYGWKNLPKRKASRVVEANRAISYSKALMTWNESLRNPLSIAQLDIVLTRNPSELKPDELLPIQVFFRGKPVSGVQIEGSNHEVVASTDDNGIAKIQIRQGWQLISADHKVPIQGDPDADSLNLTATLTFEVDK